MNKEIIVPLKVNTNVNEFEVFMFKVNTLVLGLEHFIDKIGYQAQVYSNNKLSVRYLVNDKTNTSIYYSEKYSADVVLTASGVFSKLLQCFLVVYKSKPEFIEVYDTGKMLLFYSFICFVFNHKMIFILRGGEVQRHKGKKLSFNFIKLYLATKIAYRVVIKEKNIIEEYKGNNFPSEKVRIVGNAIPVAEKKPSFNERDIDLLFLNSIRKERNVLFLIDVINMLAQDNKNIKVVITGFSSLDNDARGFDLEEEFRVLKRIEDLGLKSNIDLLGFVKDPMRFHIRSKVFLFPAEVVFANYSLLESMSCGTVPIVSKGEGAEKIVTDKEGASLKLDKKDWVSKIKSLLLDEIYWDEKSKASVFKVEHDFSIDNWFKEMMAARK